MNPIRAISYNSKLILAGLSLLAMAGCTGMLPTTGPSGEIISRQATYPQDFGVQIVEVDEQVAHHLASRRHAKLFSETLAAPRPNLLLGTGDMVEVHLWEAPPATLFGSTQVDSRMPSSSRATVLPEQMIDRDGFISVPFAGRIKAAGQSTRALEADIVARLKGKANLPEAFVRLTRTSSSTVTVVGEVQSSLRFPLTAGGERVLDALAAAGGVRQPVSKVTLQITRGENFHAMPLDSVIRDPRQNVLLQPGDVMTAMFQPLSFTTLGATGKNEEIPFEAQGISLAQALARSGGLTDSRADAQGVFVFRMEAADALDWRSQPVRTLPNGLVPVVYRLNLKDPRNFFVIQNFAVADKDVLYVSNAPAAELQKFLNLVFSIAYPVLNTIQVTK